MSNLLTSQDIIDFESGLNDLFDTNSCKTNITVVKEYQTQAINPSAGGIFGYGLKANINNYSFTKESKDFPALIYTKNPTDGFTNIQDKITPNDVIFVRVQIDAKNYILDGRNNLHIIYKEKKYNILSEERASAFLGVTFYTFRLQMVK